MNGSTGHLHYDVIWITQWLSGLTSWQSGLKCPNNKDDRKTLKDCGRCGIA